VGTAGAEAWLLLADTYRCRQQQTRSHSSCRSQSRRWVSGSRSCSSDWCRRNTRGSGLWEKGHTAGDTCPTPWDAFQAGSPTPSPRQTFMEQLLCARWWACDQNKTMTNDLPMCEWASLEASIMSRERSSQSLHWGKKDPEGCMGAGLEGPLGICQGPGEESRKEWPPQRSGAPEHHTLLHTQKGSQQH
jgi:hypothetical protein